MILSTKTVLVAVMNDDYLITSVGIRSNIPLKKDEFFTLQKYSQFNVNTLSASLGTNKELIVWDGFSSGIPYVVPKDKFSLFEDTITVTRFPVVD